MYRTILVPLDGSTFAELALPTAAALAQVTNAKLLLVRAAAAEDGFGADSDAAEVDWVLGAKRYLVGIASQLSAQGIQVETAAPYLRACEGILLESQAQHADIIVMCTSARSRFGRWLSGSIAEQVLAASPIPVMLLRPADARAEPPVFKDSTILVPLDGSILAEAVLPHATALAQALNAKLSLLRVIPIRDYRTLMSDGSAAMEQLMDDEQARADKYLAEISERLTRVGLTVTTRACAGWSADSILDESEVAGASVIILTTHGRTGSNEQVMGSVAREILEWSTRPLLLVHPQQTAD